MEQQGDLDKCFPLVEFTYNNNFYASIGMTPFETLYGRKFTTTLYWYEIEETLILTLTSVHLSLYHLIWLSNDLT